MRSALEAKASEQPLLYLSDFPGHEVSQLPNYLLKDS